MTIIKGNFQITTPSSRLEMTMTQTMTLNDWTKVATELTPDDGRQLDQWHPAEMLRQSILEMVSDANKHFHFYSASPSNET